MNTYMRLWAYVKPYYKFLVPFFVLTLVATIFNVFQFTLIIPILNFLFDTNSNTLGAQYAVMPEFSWSLVYFKDVFYHFIYEFKKSNPIYALYFMAAVIVLAVVLTNIFRYFAQLYLLSARTLLVKRLREALFEKINKLHLGFFTKEHKGDLLTRMNSDVQVIEGVAANSVEVVFKEPYLLIGYFIALFVISTKLMLFTLIIIPISVFGIAAISKRLKQEAKEGQQSLSRMLTIIDETLNGMRIIRAFNATNFIQKKFAAENEIYRHASMQAAKRRELAPSFSEASGVFIVACILVYGGALVLQENRLSASSFIAFMAIFSQVIRPAKAIVTAIANIQQGKPSGDRILEILDQKSEVENRASAVQMNGFNKGIYFENVQFSYGDKPVLNQLSFEVKKGQKIALVGPSGVGKSTIADLIPRFYDVSSGSIKIDDYDIRDYTLESLRSHISLVSQDIVLFNDSIFNNIALGAPHAKMEDVVAAAKIANAHDFILATENGYETNIGERGSRLSGGQRQRLSLARAVFKNAPILILDEATSALDTASEKAVKEAIDKLMEGRTSIVIAHRLSTIKEADEIIVLQDGNIIERGTHQELLALDSGAYLRLTQLQNIQ